MFKADEDSKGEDSGGNGGDSVGEEEPNVTAEVAGAEESTTTAPSSPPIPAEAAIAAAAEPTDIAPAPAPTKRTRMPAKFRTRKPVDMPRRPLTSYNIFFRDERAKIIAERDTPNDSITAAASNSKAGLFETLGKMIASRWKEVSPETKSYYKKESEKDTERYRKEMVEYKRRLEERNRLEAKNKKAKARKKKQSQKKARKAEGKPAARALPAAPGSSLSPAQPYNASPPAKAMAPAGPGSDVGLYAAAAGGGSHHIPSSAQYFLQPGQVQAAGALPPTAGSAYEAGQLSSLSNPGSIGVADQQLLHQLSFQQGLPTAGPYEQQLLRLQMQQQLQQQDLRNNSLIELEIQRRNLLLAQQPRLPPVGLPGSHGLPLPGAPIRPDVSMQQFLTTTGGGGGGGGALGSSLEAERQMLGLEPTAVDADSQLQRQLRQQQQQQQQQPQQQQQQQNLYNFQASSAMGGGGNGPLQFQQLLQQRQSQDQRGFLAPDDSNPMGVPTNAGAGNPPEDYGR